MSSMSSVAGLSKYIRTFPKKKTVALMIIIESIIVGILYLFISPFYNIPLTNKLIQGGIFGFAILGVSTLLGAIIQQYEINLFNGINIKQKHSLLLSLISMNIIAILIIIGAIFSLFTNVDYLLNSLIFGTVLCLGFNIFILKSTTKLKYVESLISGLNQPILVFIMIILSFLIRNMENPITIQFIPFIIKTILASVVFILTIYLFIKILEAPMKKNLGINLFDMLSYLILHINEDALTLEKLFDKMGEYVDTVVSFISFKNDKGIKSLFISPYVHPGPLGDIGGSNMPTILANKFNHFTMVVHGPSTHDLNPVSVKEIDKIEACVKEGLKEMEYSSKATQFIRYSENKSKIGVQFFNEGMIILSTFAPEDSDDIECGVGLTMMTQSKSVCNVKDSIIVDCHNSFTPESGGVLPGNSEVFELINLINQIKKNSEYDSIKVGVYSNPMEDLSSNEGVGQSGIKIMVVEIGNQRTAYVLFDANNMEKGFRQEIIDAVKDLEIDEIEVMTTDTHFVNTLSRGYNPIGINNREKIIEYVKEGIKLAIDDLEEVEVGTGSKIIKNIKTFGPNNSTELISTVSSSVSVLKIIAPGLLIAAIIVIYFIVFFI